MPSQCNPFRGVARTFFTDGTNYIVFQEVRSKAPPVPTWVSGIWFFYNRLKNRIIFSNRPWRAELSGRRRFWHVGCIRPIAGWAVTVSRLAPEKCGDCAYRRPPVWRAVVRPARYFFLESKKAYWRVSAAIRRTIGKKVSKSTGFATCRSNPAAIAAATSPFEA